MAVQHTDIFHCQKCGRIAYEPHGSKVPTCCGETMVRAVSGAIREVAGGPTMVKSAALQASQREHAVMEEVGEIARWCHSVIDEDGSRYGELADRLRSLHDVMLDRFDAEEWSGDVARIVAAHPALKSDAAQLRRQQLDLLERLSQLISDLQQGEAGFRGWEEVRERFESFRADYRRHEQLEMSLLHSALG